MRIVSGSARSRTIEAPPGQDTRPTLDRVRESMFNILQSKTPGAQVLDLFAGSGALSFEAISRGAAHAVLVDAARTAHEVQLKNAQSLCFAQQTTVLLSDWRKALEQLAAQGRLFDLVFLDPPYHFQDLSGVGERLISLQLLKTDALVVIEHDSAVTPVFADGFEQVDKRRYGKAGLQFYRKREQ